MGYRNNLKSLYCHWKTTLPFLPVQGMQALINSVGPDCSNHISKSPARSAYSNLLKTCLLLLLVQKLHSLTSRRGPVGSAALWGLHMP